MKSDLSTVYPNSLGGSQTFRLFFITRMPRRRYDARHTPVRVGVTRKKQGQQLGEHQFVDVAPAPIFAGFKGLDDGMLRLVEVASGVLVFRRIATAHVAALETQAQMHPVIAHFQALFATIAAWFHVPDLFDVSTCLLRLHELPPSAGT
jgi:hypothetical protein